MLHFLRRWAVVIKVTIAMSKILLACALLLAVSGCVFPLSPKTYPAPTFSREELAFLDAPDATRDETMSTLGPPLIDFQQPGVLVYTRQVSPREVVLQSGLDQDQDHVEIGAHSRVSNSSTKIWTLFVAYDEHGRVLAHEVRRLETGDLEKASVKWRLTKEKPQ